MDPIVTSSLIKVGGSLLGGLFGRKEAKPEFIVPKYGEIRRKAEKAGFNPLTALTSAPGSVVAGGQNYMGSAIADAALHLADGMQEKAAQEGEAQQLREENAELAKKVQDLTIRPRVGGIYSGNVATPSIRSALGVPDESASGDLLSDGQPVSGGRPLRAGGVDVDKSPRWSDAEDFETRYGDLGSSLIGLGIMGADGYRTVGGMLAADLGPKRSTNDLTFGDQGYPRNYARPPGSGKKSSRQHLPYINYPMYRPTPFAGPR